MEKYLHVKILTPYGIYLTTDADFLSVTSSLSVLGIMPNHTPLVTTLEVSKLVLIMNGKKEAFAIGGGVLRIENNSNAILLLDSIESKNEIDFERANKAKERAENMLSNHENVDVARAKSALARALNRIKIFNED